MSVHPKAYRFRLLHVLVSNDITLVMNKLNQFDTGMDLLDTRYWLMENWNERVEDKILNLIKTRINVERANG